MLSGLSHFSLIIMPQSSFPYRSQVTSSFSLILLLKIKKPFFHTLSTLVPFVFFFSSAFQICLKCCGFFFHSPCYSSLVFLILFSISLDISLSREFVALIIFLTLPESGRPTKTLQCEIISIQRTMLRPKPKSIDHMTSGQFLATAAAQRSLLWC